MQQYADGGSVERDAFAAAGRVLSNLRLPKAVDLEQFMRKSGEARLPSTPSLESFMSGSGQRAMPKALNLEDFMPSTGARRMPEAVPLESFMPNAREPRLPSTPQLDEFMPGSTDGYADGGLVAKALKAIGNLPPARNSRLTQIATTGPSYDKAAKMLGQEGRMIDYGAGRGHGARALGADSFEPYPQGWTPTYTNPNEIPDDLYQRLVNLNVLNVLSPEARAQSVENMGRIVSPGGSGVISTRGRDVMSAKGEAGPEPMSLIIGEGDRARYQKGFTPKELREYVGDTLGPRFDVDPADVGAASVMFRRNRAAGGSVDAALHYLRGGHVLSDDYPTSYMPHVGRQVMADGGAPDSDIAMYERQMAERERMPEDIRSMTHRPAAPTRPVEIEGGFLSGKRQLMNAPYDVAGPLSGALQTAYDLKTLPFYFTPAAPLAMASDIGEGMAAGSPAQVAMSALGPMGKAGRTAAGAATGLTAAVSPDEAKAGAIQKALNAIRAYHGSPHKFDRFDMSKIGTGEGAQAYGHGLYFAESEPIAKSYRDKLTASTYRTPSGDIFDPFNLEHMNVRVAGYKSLDDAIDRAFSLLQTQPGNKDMLSRDLSKLMAAKEAGAVPAQGHMYEVNINADPARLLDWDKPLGAQPLIADRFNSVARTTQSERDRMPIRSLLELAGDPRTASEKMRAAGIPGIRYLDAGSRNVGEGSRNYVIFDDKLIDINRRYKQGGSVSHRALMVASRYT